MALGGLVAWAWAWGLVLSDLVLVGVILVVVVSFDGLFSMVVVSIDVKRTSVHESLRLSCRFVDVVLMASAVALGGVVSRAWGVVSFGLVSMGVVVSMVV